MAGAALAREGATRASTCWPGRGGERCGKSGAGRCSPTCWRLPGAAPPEAGAMLGFAAPARLRSRPEPRVGVGGGGASCHHSPPPPAAARPGAPALTCSPAPAGSSSSSTWAPGNLPCGEGLGCSQGAGLGPAGWDSSRLAPGAGRGVAPAHVSFPPPHSHLAAAPQRAVRPQAALPSSRAEQPALEPERCEVGGILDPAVDSPARAQPPAFKETARLFPLPSRSRAHLAVPGPWDLGSPRPPNRDRQPADRRAGAGSGGRDSPGPLGGLEQAVALRTRRHRTTCPRGGNSLGSGVCLGQPNSQQPDIDFPSFPILLVPRKSQRGWQDPWRLNKKKLLAAAPLADLLFFRLILISFFYQWGLAVMVINTSGCNGL